MSLIIAILHALVLGVGIVLALLAGYLLLLAGAALLASRRTPPRAGSPTNRFAILVPAHNEERLLPQLLESLERLDYPKSLYSVQVVADNCSDQTAALGREAGATVYERTNTELVGKGYALEWLLEQVWHTGEQYDAYLILDADSLVSPDFLRIMDARLARGERVIQAYYAVRDPEQGWNAGLRAVALILLHYLRPLGRMVVGGSAGLKGNGMVFAAGILRQHRWTASLTEDIEYHMRLILAGERATFAPDAIVWAEMPGSLGASESQHARWERGRIEMLQHYVPRLLAEAVRRPSFLLFDAAVEQIIPPFSVLAAASIAYTLVALVLGSPAAIALGVGLLLGQLVYILTGLALARAPRSIYRALLFAPVFMAWKVVLYLRLLAGGKPKTWVRTSRNGELPATSNE